MLAFLIYVVRLAGLSTNFSGLSHTSSQSDTDSCSLMNIVQTYSSLYGCNFLVQRNCLPCLQTSGEALDEMDVRISLWEEMRSLGNGMCFSTKKYGLFRYVK